MLIANEEQADQEIKKPESKILGFTYNAEGQKPTQVDPQSRMCCAQLVITPKKRKFFYIRRGYYGSIYNPWGLFYKEDKNIQYIKVSEQCFELYIKFLTTRNQSYFLQVEREVING